MNPTDFNQGRSAIISIDLRECLALNGTRPEPFGDEAVNCPQG
jgi:hypothetical protein